MEISELNKIFKKILNSKNYPELLRFSSMLTTEHSIDMINYHYSLLKEKGISKELYDLLCKKFVNHGEEGEKFLLKIIKNERDLHIRGIILQILGSMKYSNGKHLKETLNITREFINSNEEFLRNRATIVFGWIGEFSDIKYLKDRLINEKISEIRGLAATSFMQLYFNDKNTAKHSSELLSILKAALIEEQDDFVKNSILISIQEISGKKFGLNSKSGNISSKEALKKAREKAIKFLDNI